MRIGLTLVAVALLLAGCGGDGGGGADAETTALGERVFADTGCGGCHTLAAAKASGVTGPDLDQLRPSIGRVAEQVRLGGNGMPAYDGKLSAQEIDAVALYVSQAAGGAGDPENVDFEPDDTTLADCEGDQAPACYEQAFGNAVYEDGPQKALTALAGAMESTEPVAVGCHRIAHRMGSAGLIRYEGDVGRAFAEGDAVCSSGYYHGILERAFADVEDSELGAKAKELCTTGSIAGDEFLAFQCNHGLGHGLMIRTRYELPTSLDVCAGLGGGYPTEACQGGTFMENFSSSYGIVSGYLKDDDLIYPCNDVAQEAKAACYIIVTARIMPEVGYSYRRAADVCRSQAEAEWVYMCFRSYGRDAISTNAYDEDEARRICRIAREWEGECVLSVALHIANEERRVEGAGRFCRETPSDLRVYCFTGVGATAALLYPDPRRRQRACDRLTRVPGERFACARSV